MGHLAIMPPLLCSCSESAVLPSVASTGWRQVSLVLQEEAHRSVPSSAMCQALTELLRTHVDIGPRPGPLHAIMRSSHFHMSLEQERDLTLFFKFSKHQAQGWISTCWMELCLIVHEKGNLSGPDSSSSPHVTARTGATDPSPRVPYCPRNRLQAELPRPASRFPLG